MKYALITTAAVHVNFSRLAKTSSNKGKRGLKQMLHQTGHAGLYFNIVFFQKGSFGKDKYFLHPEKAASSTEGKKCLLLKCGVVCIAVARASKVQQEHDPKAQHGTGNML